MARIEDIEVFYKGKRFLLKVKRVSFFGRIRGLMFRKKYSQELLFDFFRECKEPIHSLFVFFPFLALWLNERNEILEYRIVKPFTLSVKPKRSFYRLIEIPLSMEKFENSELVNFLVGKERFKYD